MNPPRRVLLLLVFGALPLGACITPIGKPYDERRASMLNLGASRGEVISSLGKPWQAEPLSVTARDAACVGPSESWTYSYLKLGKVQCASTLSFDGRGTLCAKTSLTTLPGAECQGVAR